MYWLSKDKIDVNDLGIIKLMWTDNYFRRSSESKELSDELEMLRTPLPDTSAKKSQFCLSVTFHDAQAELISE